MTGKESTFSAALEAIERLTLEEQQDLADIVRRRLAQRRRQQIRQDVDDARRELAGGGCQPVTVDELMSEILS